MSGILWTETSRSRRGEIMPCEVCGWPGTEERANFTAPSEPLRYVSALDMMVGDGWSESVPVAVCRRVDCRETAVRRHVVYGPRLFTGWMGQPQTDPQPVPSRTLADDRAILRRMGVGFSRWFHQ